MYRECQKRARVSEVVIVKSVAVACNLDLDIKDLVVVLKSFAPDTGIASARSDFARPAQRQGVYVRSRGRRPLCKGRSRRIGIPCIQESFVPCLHLRCQLRLGGSWARHCAKDDLNIILVAYDAWSGADRNCIIARIRRSNDIHSNISLSSVLDPVPCKCP